MGTKLAHRIIPVEGNLNECIEQLTKACQEKRDDVWDAWEDRIEDIQERYGISSALKRLCDSKSSVGL